MGMSMRIVVGFSFTLPTGITLVVGSHIGILMMLTGTLMYLVCDLVVAVCVDGTDYFILFGLGVGFEPFL